NGQPRARVCIQQKSTANGRASDADGRYRLSVSSDAAVLVFSFMGMETREVPVNGRTRVDVQLQPSSAIDMDEVVVVGYGVQKKSDVISSVVSVNTESVNKVPSNDLDRKSTRLN